MILIHWKEEKYHYPKNIHVVTLCSIKFRNIKLNEGFFSFSLISSKNSFEIEQLKHFILKLSNKLTINSKI